MFFFFPLYRKIFICDHIATGKSVFRIYRMDLCSEKVIQKHFQKLYAAKKKYVIISLYFKEKLICEVS